MGEALFISWELGRPGFFFFFFGHAHVTCRILVLQSGIEPVPPVMEAES